ncbi:MAG TPA: phosphotriesterase-related protein [Chloroflexota bacterium]|nr:phosphotriesterase-related protein [Chloroflexota bacterium]
MTVRGPIHPADLGITLMHEHVLLDLSCVRHPPSAPWQEPLVDSTVNLGTRGLLALDPYVNRANLRLDDPAMARAELRLYLDLGGRSLVDLTVQGLSPRPVALRELSEASGVHIVAGCGYYVRAAHPEGLSTRGEQEVAEALLREITEGFGETGIRPGIIGELGTSSPIHPDEAKVLRAAARVQRSTGLAINVHVALWSQEGLAVLDILESAGADLSRVVLSHLDEVLDLEYHRAVLRRGAYVEYDTFGSEFYFDSWQRREASDSERIDALLTLLAEGWQERILLSQDVCTKMHLVGYGGYGYGHLLRSIVPRLRQRGLDEDMLRMLLVTNPSRVLTSSHPGRDERSDGT